MKFKIVYAKGVIKDLQKISKNDQSKIKKEIEKLIDFPNLTNIKKLTAHPLSDYRLRVGNYRVLFDINKNSEEIYILKIGHRKDIY
jgi:mRNA interferase RelE/StbE